MTRFAFDDQVAGQADAVAQVLSSAEVPALDPSRPLIFSGVGTSLHACRVAAYWVAELSSGRIRPLALESSDLALHGPIRREDQLVVVSHRGTKRFPSQLLARAKEAGAATVLITGQGNPDPGGDAVLRTCPDELASTHTVSYLTALAVLAKLVARLLEDRSSEFAAALERMPTAIRETLALPAPVRVAERLSEREPILVTGFGIDEFTAEEAALKLKEGAYLFAEGLSQEFSLHGTPAVYEPGMAAITISPGRDDGGRFPELSRLLLELGLEVVTCGAGPSDLSFAEVDYLLRPLVAIVPLQRLVGELARIRGTNPDQTRNDQPPWDAAVARIRL
ncbi:MAG TPA: SIS domain-containing protein [Candidatus Dormibacteraeota bacterium]